MKNKLPAEFVQTIDSLLKSDAANFWQALTLDDYHSGLRVNPRKTDLNTLKTKFLTEFTPLPWEKNGYALSEAEGLGKHPFHGAGTYYLQEPSAMVPVTILNPQPGERILDLCAAPGGKTTQIESWMQGRGFLLANDPNPHRVQALALNIERWGAVNISITRETPQRLADHFGAYFDRVLVDAPCSGEGTFRSHPGEIKKWSPGFSQRCAAIQDEILWYAGKLVRPGGFLVYSTCTFNQLENEGTITRFLEKGPGFALDPIPRGEGFSPGIPISGSDPFNLERSVRIWPHITSGEGHFIARMQKEDKEAGSNPPPRTLPTGLPPDQEELYRSFFETTLEITDRTRGISPSSRLLTSHGNQLYWIQEGIPALEGLNVQRWGWWLGTFKPDRFLPSPALAAGIKPADAQKVLEFSIGESELITYQRGSPITIPEGRFQPGSWVLVAICGESLGWGKAQKGRLKSYYPSWLRFN